jgi:O-antigen ligase
MGVLPLALLLPTHPALLDPAHSAYELYLTGGNPIPMSRGLGTAAVLAIVYGTTGGLLRRIVSFGTALVMILTQFVIGERGPILAVLLVFVVIPKSTKRRIQVLLLIAALALIAGIAGLHHPNNKFSVAAVEDDGRVNIIDWGLRVFNDQPLFGAGLGAFYLPNGNREYLHNLEGELVTETGLVGLAVFAAFLLVLYQCRSRVRTPVATGTLAIAVYWFAAAQVSGDIVSNAMCWVTAILWACSQLGGMKPLIIAGRSFPDGLHSSEFAD